MLLLGHFGAAFGEAVPGLLVKLFLGGAVGTRARARRLGTALAYPFRIELLVLLVLAEHAAARLLRRKSDLL
jgi:hypothetical protein